MTKEFLLKNIDDEEFYVGDYVSYRHTVCVLEGKIIEKDFMGHSFDTLIGKQILSTKFKLLKKAKSFSLDTHECKKITKDEVINNFRKIYLDWNETMKNIDTAFGGEDESI